MASEERNALAELAKRLDTRKSKEFIVHVDGYDVSLARRIIAKLAKVSDGHWHDVCNGHLAYCCNSGSMAVQCCIGKCREIAKEGAKE